MSYYIYLGENPTGFVGLEGNIKKNFMVEIDDEENKARIAEFLKTGTLMSIPKEDYLHYKNLGIDRKRNEVQKYLENKKIPTVKKIRKTPKKKGDIIEEL